jgi:hypothetical protein
MSLLSLLVLLLLLKSEVSPRSLAWAFSRADKLEFIEGGNFRLLLALELILLFAFGNLAVNSCSSSMAQGSSSFLVFFDRDPNDQSSFRDFSLPGASGKGQSETPKSDFEDRSVVEEQEDFKRGDAGKPQEEPDEEEEEEVVVALDEAA